MLFQSKTDYGHNVVPYRYKNKGKKHRAPCKSHDKPTTAFCKDCERPLCKKCIDDHQSHKHEWITCLLKRKFHENAEARNDLINLLREIENEKNMHLNYRIDLKHNEKTMERQIRQCAETFRKTINRWQKCLLNRLKEEFEKLVRNADCKLTSIQNRWKQTKKQINDLDTQWRNIYILHNPELMSVPEIDVIQESEKEKMNFPKLFLSTSEFDMKYLFEFANIDVSNSKDFISESNVYDITHLSNKIKDISYNSEKEAIFVAEEHVKEIKEINDQGDLGRVFTTEHASDHIKSSSKGIIYGSLGNSSISMRRWETPQKVEPVFNEKDWFPRCINVTKNDEIIILLKSWPEQRGKVVFLNDDFMKIKVIEYDEEKRPIYRDPKYIVEHNVNSNICVSDRSALVVVDKVGKYRFRYTGRTPEVDFNPLNICVNSKGCILLLDVKSQLKTVIHEISSDGELLRYIMSPQLQCVTAMDIAKNDYLLIAKTEGKIQKIELMNKENEVCFEENLPLHSENGNDQIKYESLKRTSFEMNRLDSPEKVENPFAEKDDISRTDKTFNNDIPVCSKSWSEQKAKKNLWKSPLLRKNPSIETENKNSCFLDHFVC